MEALIPLVMVRIHVPQPREIAQICSFSYGEHWDRFVAQFVDSVPVSLRSSFRIPVAG